MSTSQGTTTAPAPSTNAAVAVPNRSALIMLHGALAVSPSDVHPNETNQTRLPEQLHPAFLLFDYLQLPNRQIDR